MTSRPSPYLMGMHGHDASVITGLSALIAAASGVVIFDATSLTDGAEDTFTTPSVFSTGRVRVFLNGLLQRPGVDFTEGVGLDSIVMTAAPANDDELIVVYGTDGDSALAFLDLIDTPSSFVSHGSEVVAVKADESGLEFITASSGGTGKYDVRTPPVSPNAMDDEFNDDTSMSGPSNGLDAKWTWRNQSTATATFPHTGRLKLAIPTSASASYRILEQAVAAGDFAFEMKCSLNSRQANFGAVGLIAIDRAGGDFYIIGLQTASVLTDNPPQSIIQQAWNSPTSFGSAVTARKYAGNAAYFKIERLSGALWFWHSDDGESWVNITAALTDLVGVDGIGIGVSEEHNNGGTFATIEYFRRTL